MGVGFLGFGPGLVCRLAASRGLMTLSRRMSRAAMARGPSGAGWYRRGLPRCVIGWTVQLLGAAGQLRGGKPGWRGRWTDHTIHDQSRPGLVEIHAAHPDLSDVGWGRQALQRGVCREAGIQTIEAIQESLQDTLQMTNDIGKPSNDRRTPKSLVFPMITSMRSTRSPLLVSCGQCRRSSLCRSSERPIQ
jgi:hypothetical protein